MVKRKLSRAAINGKEEEKMEVIPTVRDSDHQTEKITKGKWTNKQRTLVFASRGITYRDRHLMDDIRSLLPHSKSEPKKEKKDDLRVINEIAEMKNCNKCIYFEGKKQKDLYLWIANVPDGPSVKFLVLNAHTMRELKMTGNCLRGSRPLLSFDKNFDEPHWQVMKELFVQTFSTPNYHPKSQPFFDHVFTFSIVNDKIWFRNFQILEEDGQLAEIGPRFVLDPIKIFNGSFGGMTLWDNKEFVTPNTIRSERKKAAGYKYLQQVQQKQSREARAIREPLMGDPTNDIFQTEVQEKPTKSKKMRKF